MSKITIKMTGKWVEFEYYARWFERSKNLKTKRKLLIKCAKVLDEIGYKDLFKKRRSYNELY